MTGDPQTSPDLLDEVFRAEVRLALDNRDDAAYTRLLTAAFSAPGTWSASDEAFIGWAVLSGFEFRMPGSGSFLNPFMDRAPKSLIPVRAECAAYQIDVLNAWDAGSELARGY